MMKHPIIVLIFLGLAAITGCKTPDLDDPFGNTHTLSSCSKWRYNGDLHAVMGEATQFRLLIGFPGRTFKTPLVDTTDPTILADLKKHIVFNKTNPVAMCACLGDYTFEWFRDNTLLAQVTLHDGTVMRWRDHWDGDAWLAPGSDLWLCRFVMFEMASFVEKLNEEIVPIHRPNP
jgi:hypothetical protein